MSSLTYSIFVGWTVSTHLALRGAGKHWYTSVEDGATSYLPHLRVWTSDLSVHEGTPVQGMLSIWPPIPIIIFDQGGVTLNLPIPNIIAALERHDRVYGIWIHNLTNPQWRIFSVASQKQFPALNFLKLGPNISTGRTLPLEFLGGSSPSLRVVRLNGIPFPALPHLLLSTRDLVHLHLSDIPIEGYVSPIAMVAGLSVLANLQKLSIGFRSSKSPSSWTILFPRPRRLVILPALTDFGFRGISDYLEDFVA